MEKNRGLARETNIRVQEAERTPPKVNENRPTPHHVIVQFANIRSKDRVLIVARGKKILTYRGKISEEHQTCLQRPGKPEKTGKTYSEH